ncbi:MAG: muraminidase [Azospirillum brasilense]|nr:MAG: muraminidase [Azospirillum brasilense]
MMRTSEDGLALIRHFEGVALCPYRCPAGLLTVGYGHVLLAGEPRGCITPAQAEQWLRDDVALAAHAVARLVPRALQPWQFDALVSFTFNVGVGALERSALRQRLLAGEDEEVPYQLQRWVYAKGRKLPGLIRRRSAESLHFMGKSWHEFS